MASSYLEDLLGSNEPETPPKKASVKDILNSLSLGELVEEEETDKEEIIEIEDTPLVVAETKKETTAEPPKKEKSSYSEEQKKKIVLAMIKPGEKAITHFSINSMLTVGFRMINEKDVSEYNAYLEKELSTGDKRTQTQYFPEGGRMESVVYYNQDYPRAELRAKLALYLHSINKTEISGKDILDRIKTIMAYSPTIIDLIFSKGLLPYLELLDEAKRDFENF